MGNVNLFNVYDVSSRTNSEWNNTELHMDMWCYKMQEEQYVDILAYFWLHIQKAWFCPNSHNKLTQHIKSQKKVMEKDNHWIGKIHFHILGQKKQIICVMEIIKINEPSAVLQV